MLSRSLWAETRLTVQAMTAKEESTAVKQMLNLVCEVVVELNDELRVVEHEPRLAAMLTPGSTKSTEAVLLHDFMPDQSDKNSFQSRMREKHSERNYNPTVVGRSNSSGSQNSRNSEESTER